MKKTTRIGCDSCGHDFPVKKYKSGGRGNFKHIYLCQECYAFTTLMNKTMSQTPLKELV